MTSIVKFEEQVLEFWKYDNSFVKSNQNHMYPSGNKSKKFIFFEGPLLLLAYHTMVMCLLV